MLSVNEMRSNIDNIESRICAACERSGRDRSEITLIAVSKLNPAEAILQAGDCGLSVFGENKVQELCGKLEVIDRPLSWHLIGHLQTNKVKYVIGRVEMIHSVDSLKLAEVIDRESAKKGVVTDILIEVNIGGEESKFGVTPDETTELAAQIGELKNVRLRGLMTVAPPVLSPSEARPYFAKMRELFVDIHSQNNDNNHINVLSMGMSGDFEVAIEEGATHIRVGTAIFGARDYGQHS